MKKKTGSIFFRGFIKSFLYLGAFVLLFFASYKVTGLYLEHNGSVSANDDSINMELEGSVDSVAYNLIYSVDETNEELENVVLEILNTNTECLMYLTIPVDTKLTMSSEMYQEMYEQSTEVPQIISFSSFGEYIDYCDYFDFGTNLIEDALSVDISYYTIVPNDIFDEIFTEEDDCFVLSTTVQEAVEGYTEQNIITYLTDFYDSTQCNLSKEERLTYTPALSKINMDDIIYAVIPGTQESSGYVVDLDKAEEIWNALNGNYVIEEVEALVGSVEQVSLEKNIKVLNGSGITGLASSVQEELEEAGYTVVGIANYSSSDVETTIIQVSEEGLGTDLVSYFHSATVEISEDMPYGVDIQIILGTSESGS